MVDERNSKIVSIQVIGRRGLNQRINKGSIKRLRANGPGQPMLVEWLYLPPVWQRMLIEKFGEPAKQVKQSWFEKQYARDLKAYDYYLGYRFPDNSPIKDDFKIEEYTLNASVLATVEKVYGNRYRYRKSMGGQVRDIWDIISAECNRFKDIQAHTLPENAASLRRKLSEWKKARYDYGYFIHKNHGNNAARKVTGETVQLLNDMFADKVEKPTATEVSKLYEGFLSSYVQVINNVTGEDYQPADFKNLSTTTITNYLAKWENKAGTHTLRSGDRQKHMGRFIPYHSFDAPNFSGSIISIDDRQPPFKMPNDNRVWFYNGVDLHSLAITVWVYGLTKEGIISDFYRQMVRNYAEWGISLPLELEAESSLNSSFKNTFLKEGAMFEKVHISANSARSKRIEPINAILRYDYEKQFTGWIPRHDARSESNETGPMKIPKILYEQIIEQCLRAIWMYNNAEHPTIKGKSRWDVFIDDQLKEKRAMNWRSFIPTLGFKTETSCHTGIIKLQRKEFLLGDNGVIYVGEKLVNLAKLVEGREIDVMWLDGNDGNVLKALVYERGTNNFICEALPKPRYNRATTEQTADDHAAKELMSKYQASITGFINRQVKSIDRVTVIDNRPKILNERFQMPGMRKPVSPNFGPAEILDEIPEEKPDFNTVERRFKRSLNDRF
jgi:hypothetical protein